MDEIRRKLEEDLAGYDPDPEAGFRETTARIRRRRFVRLAGATVLAVGLFGASLAALVLTVGPGRGDPAAGPTPAPTVTPSLPTVPLPPKPGQVCFVSGSTWTCITKTGDTVQVAKGRAGEPWSLHAFHAVYEGPDPEDRARSDRSPTVTRPVLCTVWEGAGSPDSGFCETTLANGGLFGLEVPDMNRLLDLEPQPFRPEDREDPLPGVEWGGFHGVSVSGSQLVSAWTPEATARVGVTVDGRDESDAILAGPFEELRTPLKWFIATLPPEYETVTYVGYDEQGRVLWEERDVSP